MPKINGDLYRTLVLTLLAGLAVLVMAVANRNVYSKEMVDVKFQSVDRRVEAVDEKVDHVEEDVRWIVRQMGGTPSAEADEDRDSPQSD